FSCHLLVTAPPPTSDPALSLHDALPISGAIALSVDDLHENTTRAIAAAQELADSRSLTLAALSPQAVLKRGYAVVRKQGRAVKSDRKSTRLNSSHVKISYAVCCLKKKKK